MHEKKNYHQPRIWKRRKLLSRLQAGMGTQYVRVSGAGEDHKRTGGKIRLHHCGPLFRLYSEGNEADPYFHLQGRIAFEHVSFGYDPDKLLLQDTWLFGGTIAENIAYGKADATREEVIQAAKAAKVDYFIRTMPKGYDTVLDNEAANLSAGQRQLLTIARVFLCDPPVLILDEATSSVDTRTEVEIGKAMKKLMKGRTSFVIAQRLSTIRDADCILFMEKGNIIEQGNHKELLKKNGAYAKLYYSQFE